MWISPYEASSREYVSDAWVCETDGTLMHGDFEAELLTGFWRTWSYEPPDAPTIEILDEAENGFLRMSPDNVCTSVNARQYAIPDAADRYLRFRYRHEVISSDEPTPGHPTISVAGTFMIFAEASDWTTVDVCLGDYEPLEGTRVNFSYSLSGTCAQDQISYLDLDDLEFVVGDSDCSAAELD